MILQRKQFNINHGKYKEYSAECLQCQQEVTATESDFIHVCWGSLCNAALPDHPYEGYWYQ